jgi:hypothetical protein
MAGTGSVEVFEGKPSNLNGQKWIRLIVRKDPRPEDREAEDLLRGFAQALDGSDYRDEFVLSIFRIPPEEERTFGTLPKIENGGYEGIETVRRYLLTYTEDVRVPLAI